MSDDTELFSQLRAIMLPFADRLVRKVDSADQLYLDTRHLLQNGQPLWFGGVQIKKRYVSYHLMPVYLNPALLEGISPAPSKRMQGKSCFNFNQPDPALLQELAELTEAGFSDYRDKGYV
jgi:hypothetical protein